MADSAHQPFAIKVQHITRCLPGGPAADIYNPCPIFAQSRCSTSGSALGQHPDHTARQDKKKIIIITNLQNKTLHETGSYSQRSTVLRGGSGHNVPGPLSGTVRATAKRGSRGVLIDTDSLFGASCPGEISQPGWRGGRDAAEFTGERSRRQRRFDQRIQRWVISTRARFCPLFT